MNRPLAWLVVSSLLLTGCNAAQTSPSSNRKLNVVATVGMITDVVRVVGGDRLDVVGLMGPGVDPHLYKPTAGDVQRLERADTIFYGGLELEGRMTDVFVKVARGGKPTVAVTEDIDRAKLREPPEFQGKYDPHIWFDVTLWREAVGTIEKQLAARDPAGRDAYRRNAEAYRVQLDELHAYVRAQIATIPSAQRVLVTAHDAFGYFGRQYGMEVRGLQGTSTATEAGARDVQDLAQFICARKLKAIFVESSVPRSYVEAVQAAARSRGCQVAIGGELFSDALGRDGTPEGTYIGMVRHNVDTITRALK
ncbi:MAG: manganese transporter [Armatimonadetes bacterium]|nr:manganese transporter [Armatimonadota bacterium]